MKIFILEDNNERINLFSRLFVKEDCVISNNVNSAKTVIDNIKFDVIFLDHDLGGEVYVNSSDENTGYNLAKHIPLSINDKTPIIIHSYNSQGAELMLKTLRSETREVYYQPFLCAEFKNSLKLLGVL